MSSKEFLDHISQVKDAWTIAAFAIAAILSAYNLAARKRGARRGLWLIVVAVCVLAIVPMIVTIMANPPSPALTIYRVRVTVVDSSGVPVEGATVRATALNSTTTGTDGSSELSIPKGSLGQDGKITVFADKALPNKALLHGTADLTLTADPNPSITIPIHPLEGALVSGIVEDEAGHAVAGARVVIPGTEAVTTDADGNFKLQTHASRGEEVELHADKPGYTALTQRHPIDAGPATLVLHRLKRKK